MHWVERDGRRLPRRVGGHVALDFCNTWAGWGEPPSPEREWLPDYDSLLAWSRYVDLLDATTEAALAGEAHRDPGAAGEAVREAHRLRAAVHDAVLDPADTAALGAVADVAAEAFTHARLRPRTNRAAWVLSDSAGLRHPVLELGRLASDLLISPAVADVSACPGADCGWLFLDPRGRRRWCSMATCGNRAKVAAFAARRRSEA